MIPLADALRRKDADMRLPGASVLDFDQLNTPEQTRWSALASVAGHPLREAADELDRLAQQLEAFGFSRSAMRAHDAARKARRWLA